MRLIFSLVSVQQVCESSATLVQAVLRGLQDPSSLPNPKTQPDPKMAAPGLADMIKAAATGDAQALQMIAHMAEEMSKAGGDMAQLAAAIRPMINGERDHAKLCKNMGPQAEALVVSILEALGKHGIH